MTLIRSANASDEASLLGLARAFPTPTPSDDATLSGIFREKLSDPCSFLAVAERGASLVGYVSGHRHPAFYAGGGTAWVDEILVAGDVRHNGIGRLLMGTLESWAGESGCTLVSLATAGARDFYGRLGYSTQAGYYKKYLHEA